MEFFSEKELHRRAAFASNARAENARTTTWVFALMP